MTNKHKKRGFTLIEIIVAIAILSMAIVSFSLLINTASRRTLRAARRWERTHQLTQAVEYFMLQEPGNAGDIDERFFDNDSYSVECSFESPEDLPEDVDEAYGGETLQAMQVILNDKTGEKVDSVIVERITKDLDK